ncbi:Nitrogen assimilation transcription factor nirA [Erysiphe neolycopersici]|uniref:Nitrogen assimilation transcription factor nirA n=1 Tax=Erysiphe neolycopersici TaxID=212602 RepID=A0A420HQQ1_9PEZI|nr:Nitrogen assimilation transcription factor nirA [Erysiphe neolycopersici]
MSGGNLKRRRGPENITQNECTECRKKRSKCDGQKPCKRCVAQGVQCNYIIPVHQSKQQLRGELEQLKLKEKQQEMLISALLSNDFSESQLEQLRNGDPVTIILQDMETVISDPEVLKNNLGTFQTDIAYDTSSVKTEVSLVTTPIINDNNKNEPNIDIRNYSEQSNYQPNCGNSFNKLRPPDSSKTRVYFSKKYPNLSNIDTITSKSRDFVDQPKSKCMELEILNQSTGWTTLSSDKTWINHLLMLYFCWEYPIFAPLSKDHFLKDFKNGNRRYCSSLLVNSILAAACRFSAQPRARLDPTDSKTAGDQFFTEAVKILESGEDLFSITKIQALNVLSIREAACGRSSDSIFYSSQAIKLAVEMKLHVDLNITIRKDSELKKHTVLLATFWGAFALDQAWSLSCGRLPRFSENIKFVKKPRMVQRQGSANWAQFSKDDPAKSEIVSSQASNDWNAFVTFCDLSDIIYRSLYILYSPIEEITSIKLLACYTEYLHWYDSNPTKMRLGEAHTPAILFSHVFYHYTILLLFRPLIKVDITNSNVSPREVCLEASDAISSLVNSYNELYTLHHAPALVPYIVLISSITKLAIYRNSGVDINNFKEGFDNLKLMTSSNATAFFGLEILKYLVEHDGTLKGLDLNKKGFEQNMNFLENLLCEKVILKNIGNHKNRKNEDYMFQANSPGDTGFSMMK